MPAEEMGKLSKKLRLAFAVCTVTCVLVLAISPIKDFRAEWKQYKRSFVKYAQTRPDKNKLLADYSPGVDQVWLPEMNVADRCNTCHQGISEPSLVEASVPQPFRAHPPMYHSVRDWGCTICHRGQGLATEVAEAHETTLSWESPILPARFLQASCGSCHQDDLKDAPQLARGRELLRRLNCQACHKLNNRGASELGPDLSRLGYKVSRPWLYKWLSEPRTTVDENGKVTVNGYETGDETRMPRFRLKEEEVRALSAFLSVQKAKPIEAYRINAPVAARYSTSPELLAQGEMRFRQMMCTTCHSLAVRSASERKTTGGGIAPELTKVGSKINKDWLIAWLRNPQSYLPDSAMPRYRWSDEDLYTVSQYVINRLTDSSLLINVPPLGEATEEEVKSGRRLFRDKGCANCHILTGIGAQKDFGPDLTAEGVKNPSELDFCNAKIEHNLISYIQAKLHDPASVKLGARMPLYDLNQADLDALTIALLSETGPPPTGALQHLVVPRREASFQPVGAFGQIYQRYKCYVCHRFNGYGGTIGPDLSYEGSRAQKSWIQGFLKNPRAIRPTLSLRMPQFNMQEQDAALAAEFLATTMQKRDIDPESVVPSEFTREMTSTGKQLYEGKYQCQSCHVIEGIGSNVGPNLNNAGNWLTPAWIERWLRNAQDLQPGTIEPRRNLSDAEIRALTAYMLTLRAGINAKIAKNDANGEVALHRGHR